MKNLKTFEEFVNESNLIIEMANLSENFLDFEKGDVILVKKPFRPSDLNFKKAAVTWWGKNISSYHNIFAKDDLKYNPGRTYKAGDPLFVFTAKSKLDSKGIATLFGYAGYFLGLNANPGQSEDDITIESRNSIYTYDDYLVRIIALAIVEGYVEHTTYSKLNAKLKDEFEADIKRDRIRSAINKNQTIVYDGIEIHKYEWSKTGYIFSGFDAVSGNEIPKKLVKFADIAKGKFLADGVEISGDPFIK